MSNIPIRNHQDFRPDLFEKQGKTNLNLAKLNVYVDVPNKEPYYPALRLMAWALGAKKASYKMAASVKMTIAQGELPLQIKQKAGAIPCEQADDLALSVYENIKGIDQFIKTLQNQGFEFRSPSDEGTTLLDLIDFEPSSDSLEQEVYHYLNHSPFVASYISKQHFEIGKVEEYFHAFQHESTKLTWWLNWSSDPWHKILGTRTQGRSVTEFKCEDLKYVLPLFCSESLGFHFFEYPKSNSIKGLVVFLGRDRRDGRIKGAAISRVWT